MAAESFCTDRGGHLVSYGSAAEQLDVEDYYVGKGLLLSLFHKSYWMGLAADLWPFFKWADNVTPGGWRGAEGGPASALLYQALCGHMQSCTCTEVAPAAGGGARMCDGPRER
jgi:hypothetical protein